ncbi:unnamed protein product [Paramecium sonneborni]|uniref:Uncharacterized protein n=1 Tax=Paramecium sonneborni TaxID=65129 RepID=A0A8S1RN95_9CILI|nr:unnamed protein product [Paramecium sonneborni]
MIQSFHTNNLRTKCQRAPSNLKVFTRVNRTCSIDQTYTYCSQISMKINLTKNRRSYSCSTYDKDSQYGQNSKTKKSGMEEFFNKEKNSLNSSHKGSVSNLKINQKNEGILIYSTEKHQVDFQKFIQNFQLDILQLEALYYWLSSFGFQRSAPLQIPPNFCYYIYQLILYRKERKNILAQYVDIYYQDEYIKSFTKKQSKYLKDKLRKQSITQVLLDDIINEQHSNYFLIFDHFRENNILNQLNLDYEILLDDFFKYFQLSNLQKDKIEQSVKEDYVLRKNNIAFGNIRFVFKQKDEQLIDFKYPIGRFENRQFCDYAQFQDEFAQLLQNKDSFQKFIKSYSEPHGERTMILFLLADIFLNISIIKNLNQDLEIQKKIVVIESLSKIYLEITTENRVCSQCVSMFYSIPVECICKQFQQSCGYNVDEKFQFIIISQFLLEPQIEKLGEQYHRIWKRQLQTQEIQQQQINQPKISNEKLQENIEAPQQEETPIELLGQQNLNKLKEQEFFICYEEQQPTGLVSLLLLYERYCKQNYVQFKGKIDQIKITNTFFLSIGKQESSQQSSHPSQQIQAQEFIPKAQKQYENRLYLDLICYQDQFVNVINTLSNIQQEQQLLVQKVQKTFKTQENLFLETRSEFYALIIKKFTSDFSKLNTKQFSLSAILNLYLEIGSLQAYKGAHTDFIDQFKKELQLKSIIDCGNFNMKLFLQDYQFLTEKITPSLQEEIEKKKKSNKELINFCQVKIYGLEESGEFLRIAIIKKSDECNSLLLSIYESIESIVKKFKNIIIVILSIDVINQQCKETINNKILSLYPFIIELKYFSIKQKLDKQMIQQDSSQISEKEWDFLDIEFFKQRYSKQNEDLFLTYEELSDNIDEQLFSFKCQIHNQKLDQ